MNLTVRIPRRLAERMKRHREVNWSEVVRRSIEDYLERLEEAEALERPGELVEKLRELGVEPGDLEPFPPEKEEEMYRGMVAEEWRRIRSTIQAQ